MKIIEKLNEFVNAATGEDYSFVMLDDNIAPVFDAGRFKTKEFTYKFSSTVGHIRYTFMSRKLREAVTFYETSGLTDMSLVEYLDVMFSE